MWKDDNDDDDGDSNDDGGGDDGLCDISLHTCTSHELLSLLMVELDNKVFETSPRLNLGGKWSISFDGRCDVLLLYDLALLVPGPEQDPINASEWMN